MDCDRAREALSARLDGEDPGVPDPPVDEHLESCPRCQTWLERASALQRSVRVGTAPAVPDQTTAILQRAGAAARDAELRPWQGALATVAVLQLVLALPVLVVGEHSGLTAHTSHELGSWDVALAVGFLFAAIRPARAWGLLPLVAALVGSLVATSLVDLAAGTASLPRESNHLLEAMGLAFVWTLARRTRRPLTTGALRSA